MGAERIIDVAIQVSEGNLQAVMASSKAEVTGLGQAVKAVQPSLAGTTSAGDVFTASLLQLQSVVDSFKSTLAVTPDSVRETAKSLIEAAEAMRKAKHEGEELPSIFRKIETSAEMREASSSIREAIENPLYAAREAAESYILSFGKTGLVVTGLLAIGAALGELALKTGEAGRDAAVLGGELGIPVESAQRISRTFKLVGEDASSLMSANRSLSKVLTDEGEAASRTRAELQGFGIQLRNSTTGELRPFDELLLEIVDKLSKSNDSFNANRVGAEALGRTYLLLAGIARELPEAFDAAKGGLSPEDIERAKQFEFGWRKIKLAITDAGLAVGVYIQKNIEGGILLKKTLGEASEAIGGAHQVENRERFFKNVFLSDDARKGPQAPPPIAANIVDPKVTAATKEIKEALDGVGGAAQKAQKDLTEYQAALRAISNTDAGTDTVIKSGVFTGKTVDQAVAQVKALKEVVENYKALGAAVKQQENLISGQERHALAGIELQKEGSEQGITLEQKFAEERLKLRQITEDQYRDIVVTLTQRRLAEEKDAIAKELAVEKDAIAQRTALKQKELARPDNTLTERRNFEAELTTLRNQGVDADDKAAQQRQTAQSRATAAIQAAEARANEEQKKETDKQLEHTTEVENSIFQIASAQNQKIIDLSKHVTEQDQQAANKKQQLAVETEIKQLESIEKVRLAELEGDGAGYKARIQLVEQYAAKIQDAVTRLNALKIAEGEARDKIENDKNEKEVGPQSASKRYNIAAGLEPGLPQTTAGADEAKAQAAKSTAEQTDKTTQAVAKLNEEFKKNLGGNFFKSLDSSFRSSVSGLVSGTKTWGTAWRQMTATMVTDAITSFAMIGIHFAEMQLRQLLIHIATEQKKVAITAVSAAAQTAATAAGEATSNAVQKEGALKSIFISAKQAYASVSANPGLNSIPFIGPAIAQAAGVTAFAAILALGVFEKGGIVPDDQLAYVHKNEMVLPAPISRGVQGMIKGGGGAPGGGGDQHFHFAPTLQTLDATSMDRVLDKHQRLFAKKIGRWARDGQFA